MNLHVIPCLNTLRLQQKGRHFADSIFKSIFFLRWCILIHISLEFVPEGLISYKPWLDAPPATSHYLKQCRPTLLIYKWITRPWWINSLAPGKFEWNFRYLIFQIISVIDGWVISCELALRWMSLNLTDDKSTLVQVMAWCRQATSHYLNQCWPRSPTPYGITRPQWVN